MAAVSSPLPSRDLIAATQPSQLTGAVTRYAMSIAYQMITPNPPVNGGKNVGEPIVAYNPYLEADFNAKVFEVSRPVVNANSGITWTGRVGVETNCMTCHSLAALTPSDFSGAQDRYGTTFYIAQDDPLFLDTVQTDFLWSIPDVVRSQLPSKKK